MAPQRRPRVDTGGGEVVVLASEGRLGALVDDDGLLLGVNWRNLPCGESLLMAVIPFSWLAGAVVSGVAVTVA